MNQKQHILTQTEGFDEILDVRSPSEYALDHIPGAINFPVLDDCQRAHVGTLHQQASAFEARKQGAALVARNIAQHIEQSFCSRPKNWKPLVYCWRGGARSKAMTHILNSIGWHAEQLQGGYKFYRRAVIDTLQEMAPRVQFSVLCGRTGVGKSRLLEFLHAQGAQVLDLEKFANHRGSVLGEPTHGEQPSQKWFESLVCDELRKLDLSLPVYVEAESKRIGRVQLPEALINSIRSGQCLRIEATPEQRTIFLIDEYHYFIDNPDYFETALQRLKPYVGIAQIEQWLASFRQGCTAEVVKDLIDQYYDPLYLRSITNNFPQYDKAPCIELGDITDSNLSRVACAIITKQHDRKSISSPQPAEQNDASGKPISDTP